VWQSVLFVLIYSHILSYADLYFSRTSIVCVSFHKITRSCALVLQLILPPAKKLTCSAKYQMLLTSLAMSTFCIPTYRKLTSTPLNKVITKPLITNRCTKRVLSSIVTHSYMFRPCWVIFRENFFVIVTLRLHFVVEWECAVDCVLRYFWRRELCGPGLQCRHGPRRVHASSTQSTVNSTFPLNYKVQP
jgi:hypothetical protein